MGLKNYNFDMRYIKAGVRQGSMLGPFLFILFINDLPSISEAHINLYADDTSLMLSSDRMDTISNRLTKVIYKISIFHKWEIKVNYNF